MRIQCTCGAKFSFEVTPEMKDRPARFVCPACGADASEAVNSLVQAELSGRPVAAGPIPTEIPRPTTGVPRAVPAGGVARSPTALCAKHGQPVIAKCSVCGKPICPKCMETFGYLCSPLCKARAQSHGISVPHYEHQRAVVESRFWRKTALGGWIVGGVLFVLIGFWIWYAWIGSQPAAAFSVRFEQPAYSGQMAALGKDQLIVLRGGTLARYDLRTRKPAWSRDLIDHRKIEADANRDVNTVRALAAKAAADGSEDVPEVPERDELVARLERRAAADLELRVQGTNIWISQIGKLVLHDAQTGLPKKEIAIAGGFSDMLARGDEVWFVEKYSGVPTLTKVNLLTGLARTSEIGAPAGAVLADGTDPEANAATAGLPTGTPGRDLGKPMDPGKVAQQVGQLSTPARLALPAMLANTLNQERMLEELKSEDSGKQFIAEPGESIQLIPAPEGFIQVSMRLVEERFVERDAMGTDDTSALNGPISLATSGQMANAMLNQIQRARAGATIREDRSLYLVSMREPGAPDTAAWKTEVTGYPKIYPLQNVTVLAAGKVIRVHDRQHRKLWQAELKFPVYGGLEALEEDNAPVGRGPCVENQKHLFVYDAGELTAFDLFSGKVLWQYQQPGISGLFIDDKGMLYVNVSGQGLRDLQHSRDMSLWRKISPMVTKIDPSTGKVSWSAEPGGMLHYVSGKFLYVLSVHNPNTEDEDYSYRRETGYERAPFTRIKRLDPQNGRRLWEHFEQRAPLDFHFDQRRIKLLFKKEILILDYFSL